LPSSFEGNGVDWQRKQLGKSKLSQCRHSSQGDDKFVQSRIQNHETQAQNDWRY